MVERLLPKQDIVSSSLITRSAEKHRHIEVTVFYVSTDCCLINYFLDSPRKSFGTFIEPVVEYLFIRRFNMSIFSGLERLFFAVIMHQFLRCAQTLIKK